jgi:hypothetical protein
VKTQDSMDKTNFCLSLLAFRPWAVLATCRSSFEKIGKKNLIPVFNKTSPRAYTESELDVLGVYKKQACKTCSSLVLKK